MIPTMLSRIMKVKNLRYVLNHRSARTHRGIFGFVGVGFFGTVVCSAVALIDPRLTAGLAAGHDRDRSGILGFGVIPSCTGESGDNCEFERSKLC
jgi:hypothetical protein